MVKENEQDRAPPRVRRGRNAAQVRDIPARGWLDIVWRVWRGFNRDSLAMVARSMAFSWVLALFPSLAAFVSLYGLIANPELARRHLALLAGVVPASALTLIGEEMVRIASQAQASLSVTFLVSIVLALASANTGMKSLIRGLNIAYLERERRGWLRLNALSIMLTVGAFVFVLTAAVSLLVAPPILKWVGVPAQWLGVAWLRWPLLMLLATCGLSVVYRVAPNRRKPRWPWVTVGSVLSAGLWLAMSSLFSWYVAASASFSATYGSLGAGFGFFVWTWLTAVIVLLGAKTNAEIEHQTRVDTTIAPDLPMGSRGAEVADTLGANFSWSWPRRRAAEAASNRQRPEDPLSSG